MERAMRKSLGGVGRQVEGRSIDGIEHSLPA
jgi:hypothetical protein